MLSNANLFKAFSKIEEHMIRASMPKTSAADPFIPSNFKPSIFKSNGGSKLIKPLSYSLASAFEAVA